MTDYEGMANGLLIVITGILGWFGIRRGMKSEGAKEAPKTLEIAGALVDSRAVEKLSGEVTGQAIAITAQAAATKDQTRVLERQTEAIIDLKDEVRELRHEMRSRR